MTSLLQDTERAHCAVCSDLLKTAPYWLILSAFAGLTLTSHLLHAKPDAVLFAFLALLGGQVYLTVRVRLDAQLFDRLARGETAGLASLELLDAALNGVLEVKTLGPTRDVQSRIRGARRLYTRVVLCSVALCVLSSLPWLRMLSTPWSGA